MPKSRLSTLGCVVGASLAAAIGCGKTAPPATPGPLSQAIASWESGNKDKAAELLVTIDWNQADLTSDAPLLFSLTQQELASMWRRTQDRLMTDELLPASTTSRDLARHVLSLGRAAQDSGDEREAKTYYEAALNLGRCLSQTERVPTAHLVGKAIVAMAEEQLSSLSATAANSEGH